MYKRQLSLLFILLVALSAFAATPSASFSAMLDDDEKEFLQKTTVLTVLFDPVWAPLEYFDTKGKPAGLSKASAAKFIQLALSKGPGNRPGAVSHSG